MKIRILLPLVAAGSCVVYPGYPHEVSFAGDDSVWRDVSVADEPPPARTELMSEIPSPLHLWIPGYWWWDARWIWIDGCWKSPPRPGGIWVTGHWEHRPHEWVWVRGCWR